MQIFNLPEKRKLKETTTSEPIVFWKWVNATTLALVTSTAVLHWAADGTSEPVKVFDRLPDLAACQIINYRTDDALQWLCLVGISQKDGRIAGNMQLYSIARAASQSIEGHACAFTSFVADGATKPSTMFSFAQRTATAAKVFILELEKATGSQFVQKSTELVFPPEAAADFPVACQVAQKCGVLYVLTKFGYVHLFDIGTGALIYRNRISSDTIFLSTLHKEKQGIIGINRQGQGFFQIIINNN